MPTISIKINGLQALNDGQLVGGVKLNGANLAMIGGGEGNRALLLKKGLVMREMEMEGNRMILLQPSNGAGVAKASVSSGAGVVGTKTAVATNAVTNGAATAANGAASNGAATVKSGVSALSAKGAGWTLALGGFGPWLVLGSLGLAAIGVYFYMRAERLAMEAAAQESPFDEYED